MRQIADDDRAPVHTDKPALNARAEKTERRTT